MPWLADLVQASEGSLDVLPVQCLCEFLLHDAADGAASGEEEEEGGSKEQKAKKRQVSALAPPACPWPFPAPAHSEVPWCPQRQQKQQQLLGRLQDLLLGPKADEQTTCEVLDYFLRRLGSSQVASRVLAMKVSLGPACVPSAAPRGSAAGPSPTQFSPAGFTRGPGQAALARAQASALFPCSFLGPGNLLRVTKERPVLLLCPRLERLCRECHLAARVLLGSEACPPPRPPGPRALWRRGVEAQLSQSVCLQGLSLVLSEGSLRDGEEKEPPAEEDSGDADALQGYQWLLRDLPRLPLFHSVSASTALALQQAIHMETDPQTISAYLVYLSQHTPVEEQGQHSDLALVRVPVAGPSLGWGL